MLHYDPQRVSSSTLLILRRTNCIPTASGIVTLEVGELSYINKMRSAVCKLRRICVLSIKCRVLSRFVIRCVECNGGRVWVFFVGFLQCGAWWFRSVGQVSRLWGVII